MGRGEPNHVDWRHVLRWSQAKPRILVGCFSVLSGSLSLHFISFHDFISFHFIPRAFKISGLLLEGFKEKETNIFNQQKSCLLLVFIFWVISDSGIWRRSLRMCGRNSLCTLESQRAGFQILQKLDPNDNKTRSMFLGRNGPEVFLTQWCPNLVPCHAGRYTALGVISRSPWWPQYQGAIGTEPLPLTPTLPALEASLVKLWTFLYPPCLQSPSVRGEHTKKGTSQGGEHRGQNDSKLAIGSSWTYKDA